MWLRILTLLKSKLLSGTGMGLKRLVTFICILYVCPVEFIHNDLKFTNLRLQWHSHAYSNHEALSFSELIILRVMLMFDSL